MLQIGFAPNSFPNAKLEEILLNEADKYIKAGKLTKAGAANFGDAPSDLDYRLSAFSNRIPPSRTAAGDYILGGWDPDQPQVLYRIFVDRDTAQDFINFNLQHGALYARFITEADRGVHPDVPHSVPFPPYNQIKQYLWTSNEISS